MLCRVLLRSLLLTAGLSLATAFSRALPRSATSSPTSPPSLAVPAPDFGRLEEICRSTGSTSDAVVAVKRYLSCSPSLNSRALTSCIKIYGMAALVDDSVEALAIAKEKGVEVNVFHYNACLRVCTNHKRYELAAVLIDQMKKGGIAPDSFTLSTMMSLYGELKDHVSISNLLATAPEKYCDPIFYCSALSALERCKRPEDCERVFALMKARAMPLSANIYASVIRVFGDTDVERSWEYFKELESNKDIAPTRVLLLNLISILRSADQPDRITFLKDKYPELLQRPSSSAAVSKVREQSFNDVIASIKSGGSIAKAVEYADTWLLRQRTLTPGGVTSCITIYSLAKMPLKAMAVLDLMRARGQHPNIKHYNAVMSCCLKSRLFEEAVRVLNSIEKDIAKDEFTYGIQLKMYEMKGEWGSALSLFNSLDSLGILRTTVMYNTLISALGKANQAEQAIKVYNELLSIGTADSTSHFTMVSCLEKVDRFEEAAEIRRKYLGGSGTSFPRKYSEAGTLQEKLVQQEGGGLFKLLYSAGQLRRCDEVLRECEEAGVEPHPSHYLQVLKWSGETGDWRLALDIHTRLKSRRTPIDTRISALTLRILSKRFLCLYILVIAIQGSTLIPIRCASLRQRAVAQI